MKLHLTSLLSALLISTALPAMAQQMNYQGRLTDASGNPLADGQYTIEFTLWDVATGGTVAVNQVWGPFILDGSTGNGRAPRVDLVNGRFNSVLGPVDTANRPLTDAFNTTPRYLQIKIGTNTPITPRQSILDAPTAMRAANAALAQRIPNVWPSGANVGIGTATPKQALHVNGAYYGKGHMWLHAFEGDGASGVAYIQARDDSAASTIGMMLRTKPGSGYTDAMYIDPLGKIAIGANPGANPLTARLTVAQSGYGVEQNDGTIRLSTYVGGSANAGYFGTRSNHPLAFFVNDGGPSMAIATNGNVGVGTVTPGAPFDVHNENLQLRLSTSSFGWTFGSDVNGHLYFSGPGPGPGIYFNRFTGQYAINSDRRLKKDITAVSGVLDRVMQLRPVSYRFNATSPDHAKTMGFIAQEVQPVFPDLVEDATNGYKAVSYNELIPITIAALQEEHQRNEELSEKVKSSNKEVADLKQRLERLEALIGKGPGK